MDENFKRQLLSTVKVIDDLDYYQILKLDQMAFDDDIKRAYFEESRLYHRINSSTSRRNFWPR